MLKSARPLKSLSLEFFAAMALAALLLLPRAAISAEAKVVVAVSIAPQKHFVERIAGDGVEVLVMAPAGADPHNYEPRPRQMVSLAAAKVYFALGVEFEQAWLPRFAALNPGMRIVHTNAGIPLLSGEEHGHADHPGHAAEQPSTGSQLGSGSAGEGARIVLGDPHIWLSPLLVKIQALHIFNALVAADPANAARYDDGYRKFQQDLDDLHRQIVGIIAVGQGPPPAFLVLHPVWSYLAHELGLRQLSIEIQGKEPKPAQLQQLIELARTQRITAVFVQPQRPRKAAEILAKELGAGLVSLDPLSEDWQNNLVKAVEAIGMATVAKAGKSPDAPAASNP